MKSDSYVFLAMFPVGKEQATYLFFLLLGLTENYIHKKFIY